MEKEKLIRSIHRILFTYEDYGYGSYQSYLTHQVIRLSGLEDCSFMGENIQILKGLKNLKEDEITHDEIRSVILGIMNDIDRNYVGGDEFCH